MTSNNDEQASRAPMAASRPPVIVISQVFYYQMAPIFVTPPPASPAPPPKTKNPFKTRSTEEPYIKKPLNAFMIFMKEQRPFVKAKMLNKDSATVNKVIGELWQSLTQEEQLKYYQESDRLRRIHDRMYPNWTCRSNYGRKKKRIWGKAATGSNDQTTSAPEPPTHTDILHEGHDTGLTSPSSELEASSSSSSSYAAESHRKDTASATATCRHVRIWCFRQLPSSAFDKTGLTTSSRFSSAAVEGSTGRHFPEASVKIRGHPHPARRRASIGSIGSMATDQEPTFAVKLAQLVLLSTYWGMQIWVTFISNFVMDNHLNRHTYGFIQSRLVPFYLHLGSACAFFNLTIFAVYHPSDMLDEREGFQIFTFFVSVTMAAVNAQWFGQMTSELMADMHLVEQACGLGQDIGLSSNREAYAKLRETDAKYRHLSGRLRLYRLLSSLCNVCCVACNFYSLSYMAENLRTL